MLNRQTVPMKKLQFPILALVGAIAVASISAPANASSTATGQLTQIEFNAGNPSWPQIAIQVNSANVNYYAQQPSPGCSVPALSADTVKAIQSLAQAAFLAGKNVVINYNVCNSANYIFDIQVQR
jgi:hypothetical protein